MSTLCWIMGKGGMLGSCTARVIGERHEWELWDCKEVFQWQNIETLYEQFHHCIDSFVKATEEKCWMILWMAGTGIVGSQEETLAKETRAWEHFLSLLSGIKSKGSLFFSSSAGTVYGQSEEMLTEHSPLVPVSPYGKSKAEQEAILKTWAENNKHVTTVIGRIGNLYGEEQNLQKAQGIISHLIRHDLHRKALHLYVPLGTIRDYVYAPDCARSIVDCMDNVQQNYRTGVITKLFASERVTTIAEILEHLHGITKRPPLVTRGSDARTAVSIHAMRFHSIEMPEIARPAETSLLTGIYRVYRHQQALFARGLLPMP